MFENVGRLLLVAHPVGSTDEEVELYGHAALRGFQLADKESCRLAYVVALPQVGFYVVAEESDVHHFALRFFRRDHVLVGQVLPCLTVEEPDAADASRPFRFTKLRSGEEYSAGHIYKNTVGSYLHLHFAGCPGAAAHFVEACRRWGR